MIFGSWTSVSRKAGAAGDRGAERPPLLPRPVRGRGILPQRLLHRRRAEPAGDPGGRLLPRGARRREVRASGHRLRLPAHDEPHPRAVPQGRRHPGGGHLRQLHPVRPRRLGAHRGGRRGARRGRQAGGRDLHHQRRRQHRLLQGARRLRHRRRGHPRRRLLGGRGGALRPRHIRPRRPPRGVELLHVRRHARERGLHRGLAGAHGRGPRRQRPDGGALYRLQHVGERGDPRPAPPTSTPCARRCGARNSRTSPAAPR